MDCYARFMIHFLDELAVDRAHLVGHSHGGRVSIALAADEPERVGRLLLIDSAGIPPKRGWRYRRRVAVAKLGRLVAKVGGGPAGGSRSGCARGWRRVTISRHRRRCAARSAR